MKDRLIQIRKKAGLTQGEFGKIIGLTDPMISLFEAGKKVPKNDTIELICYKFKVCEDWLRYGTGEMEKPPSTAAIDDDESMLLGMFRKLSTEMRRIVLEKVNEMLVLNDSWAVPPLKNPHLEKSRSASAASVVGFPLEPIRPDSDPSDFIEKKRIG